MSFAAEVASLVAANVSIARVGYGLHLAALAREPEPNQLQILFEELDRCTCEPTLTQRVLAQIAHGQLFDRAWCESASAGASALMIAPEASC